MAIGDDEAKRGLTDGRRVDLAAIKAATDPLSPSSVGDSVAAAMAAAKAGRVGQFGDAPHNAVVSEVEALARARGPLDPELVAAATRAWSTNTVRAFLSDLALWNRWCRRSGIVVGSAGPSDVARYVRVLAGIETAADQPVRASATIERYLVNIGWAYRMAGLEDPTRAPLVRLELKAARQARGVRQRQARAIRFKGEVADLDEPASGLALSNLVAACRRDLLGLRDRALLLVAYDSGCRRSELVSVDVEDVEGPDHDGAGTLFISKSKTDRERHGHVAYLSPMAMGAIQLWRERAQVERGALFRRVKLHFDGSVHSVGEGGLHPNSVTLIYRRLIAAAFEKGLLGTMSEAEVERCLKAVSSHSIRVGVAQDSLAAGESLAAIMQAYRWRDPKTVMRYGAKLAAKSGTSARLAKRFSA